MAKESYTLKDLTGFEGRLHEIAANMRKIRNHTDEAGENSVDLNLGTFLLYLAWIEGWAAKNEGAVRATMDAKKKAAARKKKLQKS